MRHCDVAKLDKGLPLPAPRALHCHIRDALKRCELPIQDTGESAPDHRQQHPGGHGGADNPRHVRSHCVHQEEIMVIGL